MILFHHAGGSGQLYDGWIERFPANWDVRSCEAPGRGLPGGAATAGADIADLVEYFRAMVSSLPGEWPLAFFGHSMGAAVAYELARKLEEQGGPRPVWLGLSACVSPAHGGVTRRSALPDAELQEWLLSAGGTSQEMARHPLLWRMIAPTLRQDLRLLESWDPAPDAPPLDAALSVFGGNADPVVLPEQLAPWRHYSRDFTGVHLYQGDHFYLRNPAHADAITRRIVDDIQRVLSGRPGRPAVACWRFFPGGLA